MYLCLHGALTTFKNISLVTLYHLMGLRNGCHYYQMKYLFVNNMYFSHNLLFYSSWRWR